MKFPPGYKALLALAFSLLAAACHAVPPLLLSPHIRVDAPLPEYIAHQDDRLIYAYDEWIFSHELLGPEDLYPGIDLTGMEREFVIALFDPDSRTALPKWLAVLAEEQAESFAISRATSRQLEKGELKLLSVFNPVEGRGEVFILAPGQIHHLAFKGNKEDFTALIAAIKER